MSPNPNRSQNDLSQHPLHREFVPCRCWFRSFLRRLGASGAPARGLSGLDWASQYPFRPLFTMLLHQTSSFRGSFEPLFTMVIQQIYSFWGSFWGVGGFEDHFLLGVALNTNTRERVGNQYNAPRTRGSCPHNTHERGPIGRVTVEIKISNRQKACPFLGTGVGNRKDITLPISVNPLGALFNAYITLCV